MKRIFLFLSLFMLFTINVYAEQSYQLSTHILDITKGLPVPNVEIKLYKLNKDGQTWSFVAQGVTDKNGRVANFLPGEKNDGTYKL